MTELVAQSYDVDKSSSSNLASADASSRKLELLCWISAKAQGQPSPGPRGNANSIRSDLPRVRGINHIFSTTRSKTLGSREEGKIGRKSDGDGDRRNYYKREAVRIYAAPLVST